MGSRQVRDGMRQLRASRESAAAALGRILRCAAERAITFGALTLLQRRGAVEIPVGAVGAHLVVAEGDDRSPSGLHAGPIAADCRGTDCDGCSRRLNQNTDPQIVDDTGLFDGEIDLACGSYAVSACRDNAVTYRSGDAAISTHVQPNSFPTNSTRFNITESI